MKHEKQHPYYPIFLNVSGRRCVIIGGGQVALRKTEALLNRGAIIEVISRDLCSELNRLAENGEISVLRRNYQTGDLREAFIAIVATDNKEINQEILLEARQDNILVNVVDNAGDSNFITPSYIQQGDLAIAISTSGLSPALSRKIRTKLEKDFGEEYALLTLLINQVRNDLKQQGIEISGDDWQKSLDLDSMIDLLKDGKTDEVKSSLLGNLKSI